MPERLFTRAQAEALLDTLRPLLVRLQEMVRELDAGRAATTLQGLNGGNGAGSAARRVGAAGQGLSQVAGEIAALGVVIKDPRSGLIDFPAEHAGQEVYLCWRLGEERVGWWHPRDTGFADRRRIDW